MTFQERLDNLPQAPGVYLMRDSAGRIIYIGKAASLKNRVSSYFHTGTDFSLKTASMVSQVKKIDYIVTHSDNEALLLEQKLIRQYKPRYNIIWRDDKSYPHLKLTLNEDYPRLFFVRKRKEIRDGARYFGPYPQVGEVRKTVRWLQKLFPLRLCKYTIEKGKPIDEKKVRSCLYYHIEHCPAPCLAKISQKKYQEIVDEVTLFLEGKHNELIETLEKKMHLAAKELNFEEAKKIRDCIQTIQGMTERINFKEIKEEELYLKIKLARGLSELKKILSLRKVPLHIEAIDVSNIFGDYAVGSLVAFEKGEPKKDAYRRYKIRTVTKIDDYAMIREVVSRRYKRILKEKDVGIPGIELPDLILIDGGKGHLSTAVETLNTLHLKLPVIALAKEKEEIYIPQATQPLSLPKNSPALHLLQHIRDEAHRFALSYHKLLRKKTSLPS